MRNGSVNHDTLIEMDWILSSPQWKSPHWKMAVVENATSRATAGACKVRQRFCVPGDAINDVTCGRKARDDMDVVSVRHEEAGAFAPGAQARLSGSFANCRSSVVRAAGASDAAIMPLGQPSSLPFIPDWQGSRRSRVELRPLRRDKEE